MFLLCGHGGYEEEKGMDPQDPAKTPAAGEGDLAESCWRFFGRLQHEEWTVLIRPRNLLCNPRVPR